MVKFENANSGISKQNLSSLFSLSHKPKHSFEHVVSTKIWRRIVIFCPGKLRKRSLKVLDFFWAHGVRTLRYALQCSKARWKQKCDVTVPVMFIIMITFRMLQYENYNEMLPSGYNIEVLAEWPNHWYLALNWVSGTYCGLRFQFWHAFVHVIPMSAISWFWSPFCTTIGKCPVMWQSEWPQDNNHIEFYCTAVKMAST